MEYITIPYNILTIHSVDQLVRFELQALINVRCSFNYKQYASHVNREKHFWVLL